MKRSVAFGLCALPLLLASATAALAIELPIRKAGLWELKMGRAGAAGDDVAMQHCTDETTDKKMVSSFQPLSNEVCSKQDTQKTATGYVTDAVCSIAGMTTTSRSEITGDFNSAYTVKVTSHNDKPLPGVPKDATMTLDAKWLGPCKSGQRPGDIVMPGGIKMNIADIEKLKALMPKPPK
ncbi:conserved hypothetical protein [Rhodopseudomonas palustris HaA2]|uniref:DUF3617 family protein n=1 Tax=Rhodopseudomonas palustris (strain HaA2) TaxID=316058 RepID=Q2ISC8_RHOP2|nr:DUF3617 family protein [Rhodopseudomonas palustris]ABD08882.1 conserved hypothetical protein [Rhodopseudomonas palustris HaA2]